MKRFFLLANLITTISVHAQTVQIGVISDLEQTQELELVLNQMIQEIDQTTGSTRNVILKSSTFGISSAASALEEYHEMEGSVDIVLSIGSITSTSLSAIDELPVPVIALAIIDPQLQNIPFINGKSGKENFTYVWQTRNLENELAAFKNLYDFKNLIIFIDQRAAPTVDEQKVASIMESLSSEFDTQFTFIPVGTEASTVIDQLPADADAAYFTVLFGQTEENVQQLINELNERAIPTFAGNARLIELGVLGSLTNDNNLQQGIRKLAIMVDEYLNGSSLSNMSVILDTKENLYVNIGTSRKIELPLPFEVLFTATLTGQENTSDKTYTFEEIAAKSLEANLDIKISYQDVELSELFIESVKSNLLPSVTAAVTGSQINEEQANAAFGISERSVTADLGFSQVLYSEDAIATVKIAGYLKKAQEYNTEALVLSVLFDTYQAYLNVLSAYKNVLVQRENLANTKKNKELASIRVSLGASANSDLFRWETELALANQAVIDAQANLMAAKLQLNTLVANTLQTEYNLREVSFEDEWLQTLTYGQLSNSIRTPRDLERVASFFVAESQTNNPNKKALLENINATNRQLLQNKRSIYLPTLSLQAQTSQVIGRGGEGSKIDAGTMAFGVTEFQDNSWFVGISLSYPIFSGFSRRTAIQQSKVTLDQLADQELLVDQRLELGVRSSVLTLLSASTNIENSRVAAENAQNNFELVQDNYTQGQVTVTDLIDAQQAALEAQLASELSIFQYVESRLQLEFNVGYFTMLMTDNELTDFNSRLQNYINSTN